jgi:PAS domain S-box-containing protein
MSADPRSERSVPITGIEADLPPLSAQERSRLGRRWQAAWPSAVVLASLIALVIVPLVTQRKTRGFWNEIATVADPARGLTTEIQLALALESSGTQEFLQTGSAVAADDHLNARTRRHRAEARLLPLAQRLGTTVTQPMTQLLEQVKPADALLDSLFDGRIARDEYVRRGAEQRERFRHIVASAGQVDEAIGAVVDRMRLDIRSAEQVGTVFESILVAVAFLAAMVVARLGRSQRSLAIRLDRRERSQAAFGEAARRLNASAAAHDVVQTLANIATEATHAYGFAVEVSRQSAEREAEEKVDVTMRLGSEDVQHEQVERAASVSHLLDIPDLSGVVVDIGSNGRMAPYLTARCGSCTALAISTRSDGDLRATLVLLRRADDEPFGDADASYLQALADLASAAFRRGQLLEALHDSEERFRQITENIREFIWLSDPEFSKHLYVNSAYEEIWGRSTESLYEDPLSLLDGVHPDDRERVSAALTGLTRGVYDIEFRVVRPNGDERWVWSRGFPVTNDRGEIYRVAGITEDITDRKRTADSRVRLVRGFTHDVKNPLGAADGFLALLEDGVMGELDPQQCESIERARQSIRRALELIANVLELARAEAGQVEVRQAPMDAGTIARDIVDEFRAQAHEKGLSLDIASIVESSSIESDAARVRQIVANLVSNAVKYTRAPGHIEVAVRVKSDGGAPRPGDWIAIEVCDDGPGIPADKQRTLFSEFTRFDPNAAEGAGIGLAISQRLAEALGGVITVQSEEGAGSTFTLWLPCEAPA